MIYSVAHPYVLWTLGLLAYTSKSAIHSKVWLYRVSYIQNQTCLQLDIGLYNLDLWSILLYFQVL